MGGRGETRHEPLRVLSHRAYVQCRMLDMRPLRGVESLDAWYGRRKDNHRTFVWMPLMPGTPPHGEGLGSHDGQ